MVARPLPCDPHRLKLLLEDRLPAEGQSDVESHLESCDRCRLQLEGMAGDAQWWAETRRFLSPSPEVAFTEKTVPAPMETSAIQGLGLIPGRQITVFKGSPVGDFAVLICSDYLDPWVRLGVLRAGIDILCVPAFQKESERYHSRMSIDCEDTDGGIYIAYANMRCEGFGDGRSAFFGLMDRMFRDNLVDGGFTNLKPPHKICEVAEGKSYVVLDVDIDAKRPSVPHTVPHPVECAREGCRWGLEPCDRCSTRMDTRDDGRRLLRHAPQGLECLGRLCRPGDDACHRGHGV